MPDIKWLILLLIAGGLIGRLLGGKAYLAMGLGVAIGVLIAFAIINSFWYLLALLIFVPLLMYCRKRKQPKTRAD